MYKSILTITILCINMLMVNAQFEPKNTKGILRSEFEPTIPLSAVKFKSKPYNLIGKTSIKLALWSFIGEPVGDYKLYWEQNTQTTLATHVFNGETYTITLANLAKYPDLKKHIDLVKPFSVEVEVKIKFFSKIHNGFIASCLHEFSIDLPSCAFDKNSFSLPGSKDWDQSFSFVELFPSVNKTNTGANLTSFWQKSNNEHWQDMSTSLKGKKEVFASTMKYLFSNTDSIKIVYAILKEIQMPDIKWILDEYCRRKATEAAKANKLSKPSAVKQDDDFWNTTYPIDSTAYFSNTKTTTPPIWIASIEKADKLYHQQQWKEAEKIYLQVYATNPELAYAKEQVDVINKIRSYKPKQENTFTDPRDGHVYKTVTIGGQTWMAENLAFLSSNGCWSYNNLYNNVPTYGYLYSWETAKNACPVGWHLPSDEEWSNLVGGFNFNRENVEGYKYKEVGTQHWKNSNLDATDEKGLTFLPSGSYATQRQLFMGLGNFGYWWSSSYWPFGVNLTHPSYYLLQSDNPSLYWKVNEFNVAVAVRCVKN